jgi:hypothetical protein
VATDNHGANLKTMGPGNARDLDLPQTGGPHRLLNQSQSGMCIWGEPGIGLRVSQESFSL